ncbi:hypothetical protein I5677_14045 [Mobilitalea sibirica]|uniref:YceG-like family protein n=1 Tax=Mobilitalea sibirica TaxID=1462919 RepID=A0A8J7HEE6_9FIRM|nr:hypothetical protein [Mobilitalea sibirica]MBH1942019.1 hypothetical protein [Mobilitalea sibirica]
MKLKYYMRGLGIGIVLTTLILSISGNKETLSDQQIIKRARSLGMVTQEEYDKAKLTKELEDTDKENLQQEPEEDLSDKETADPSDVNETEENQENDENAENDEKNNEDDAVEGFDEPDEALNTEDENNQDVTQNGQDTQDIQDSQDDQNTEETPTQDTSDTPGTEPTPTVTPSDNINEQTSNANDDITFTIERGMSSRQVSEMLVQKGLIGDAQEFNNFIIRKGKAGVIRVGTYTVKKDASFEEILNSITS